MPTKKTGAPAECRLHQIVDGRRQRVPDGPRALHERQRFAAMLGRPRLRDKRRAAGPLAAHSKAETECERPRTEGTSSQTRRPP